MFKIGLGIDVHAFEDNRKLILGGIQIPYKKGLKGHSDADVLIHSIMDSLLGASGLGDIGNLFPDTDNQYKNISSLILLQKVNHLLIQNNYSINNIDNVIIAQEPKISPYIDKMKKQISETLKIEIERINIKATTSEFLGFTGRKEGIISYSTSLIVS